MSRNFVSVVMCVRGLENLIILFQWYTLNPFLCVMIEPFSQIIIDCAGPLPKTSSGNQYLLTIMCCFTRFPEAVPLRNIKAPRIAEALIKYFTLVGLPSMIQSDQGSNFMSSLIYY